jgi:hypothetical protein
LREWWYHKYTDILLSPHAKCGDEEISYLNKENTLTNDQMRNNRVKITTLAMVTLLSAAITVQCATLRGTITSSDHPNGLSGVNVILYRDSVSAGLGAASDLDGKYLILAIPGGRYQVHIESLGYKTRIFDIQLGQHADTTLDATLEPEAIKSQEVTVNVSVTKHEVSVENTPLRVEVMVPEEVQDKIAFATTVDGALRYSGGITINNSRNTYESENIRLWGIDSRYLLLLADQMPVLGFQPENVGIWSVPLVGVKSIEIVKADHAALYGFGNSGLIDAVLRSPMNDTSKVFGLVRTDFQDNNYGGVYTGKRFGKFGLSTVLSLEQTALFDSSYTVSIAAPRIDYWAAETKAFVSADILNFYRKNQSLLPKRTGFKSGVDTPISKHMQFRLRVSVADQREDYPPDPFQIRSHNSIGYASAQVIQSGKALTVIAGVDGYQEDFEISRGMDGSSNIKRYAGFVQVDWEITNKVGILYGGRIFSNRANSTGAYGIDTSKAFETAHSGRSTTGVDQFASILWKSKYYLSHRLTISSSLIPALSHYILGSEGNFRLFVPSNNPSPERMLGANLDTRLAGNLGLLRWTGNVSLFINRLIDHIDIYGQTTNAGTEIHLTNSDRDYVIPGVELFSRLNAGDDLAILFGYMYLAPNDHYRHSPGTMLPLPHHQANFEVDWEIESTGFRAEIEGKYVGKQETPANPFRAHAPDFTVFGTTLEYSFGKVKIFSGIENLTDFVQSDKGPLWGPREGREFYLGAKVIF